MDIDAEPLDRLRQRTSAKWRLYPPDVLPLFVAEMDYPLAEPVRQRLHELIDLNDSGYVASPAELGAAFAGFADRHWGWRVDPARVRMTTDVSVAIVETHYRNRPYAEVAWEYRACLDDYLRRGRIVPGEHMKLSRLTDPEGETLPAPPPVYPPIDTTLPPLGDSIPPVGPALPG